jgi:uncharacterized protein YndB with AHSA1/START domain
MATTRKTMLTKDVAKKTINVIREFDASKDKVWDAWTKSELLEQWWAPKPWKAVTKTMNFKEGGFWFYCMAGPNGEKHYSRVDYLTIKPTDLFISEDSFCDEQGNISSDMPHMHWTNKFQSIPSGTRVEVELVFKKEEDMKKLIEMGFEGGFSMALENLDELLAK